MMANDSKVRAINKGKFSFPIIFGSTVLACCIAFYNRQYFLKDIREEAVNLFKEDAESTRMLEDFKIKYNHDKKNSSV